jgi:predicted dehydrogenase
MEKPISVDGPTSRKMFKLGEESEKKGLKVGVGLMCRHCAVRGELYDRIVKQKQIGDIVLLRAYRQAGITASAFTLPRGKEPRDTKESAASELLYQINNFHSFLWASGGAYSDFLIHNIDECCWMKDAWPTQAKSSGGREYRVDPKTGVEYVDQNFDVYSTEFTFPDGAKLYLEGRTIEGCHQEFASYCHGTKGSGVISESGHWPSHARLYKSQNQVEKDLLWQFGEEQNNPYQDEWEHLMTAIRKDKPYNEVKRGVEASLVTAMGRMAAHTGKIITREMILNSDHEFAPGVDKLVLGGEAPLKADAKGHYPQPQPGLKTKREY